MQTMIESTQYELTRATGEHRPDRHALQPARYVVRGALPFPLDMLRYDAAWPASEHDSGLIRQSVEHETRGPVEVVIYARRRPTDGRWQSFGWTVLGSIDR
jgi:hypothetical protein